jgi:hypothetical protein
VGISKPLMIYANGYPRPYLNDPAEDASASADTWLPSSVDFQATAANSGDPAGASTLADMLSIIARQPAGSISMLGLIGHAAAGVGPTPRTFGFSGQVTVTPPNAILHASGFLNADTIWHNYAAITALRSQFKPDARIVIYACHAGADKTLLNPISNAFGVCVDGFTDPVTWCFEWDLSSLRIDPRTRGRVFVDSAGLYAAKLVKCGAFNTDAKMLKPDVSSCIGKTSTTRPLLPSVTWET